MPASCLTKILRAKHAAFLIAALITSLAMESRAAEGTRPTPDRDFNDYAGVVSKEATYRFNQELAQLEREILDQVVVAVFPKMQSDSGIADYTQRVAQAGGVSQNDRRGEQQGTGRTLNLNPNPNQNPKQDPNPNPNQNPKQDPNQNPNQNGIPVPPSPWFFIKFLIALIFVIALILIISRILRRGRSEEPPRHPDKSYNPPIYPLHIAIKFKSGGDKLPQQLDGWQASLGGTAKRLAPLRLLPLFGSLNSNLLNELVDSARKNDPDYEPADFSAWFQVETPAGVNADELAKSLRKLANVETAYVMVPSPPPVPVSAEDDRRNPKQRYQDAAPDGIDARYAWGFTGGDGAGIGFVDVEQGWNLDHADLKDAAITIISGVNYMCRSHGTSVLGEVLMVDNTKGGVGIAPSAQGRVISLWRPHAESEQDGPISNDAGTTDDSPPDYNTAAAIAHAAANMSRGDVLLVEVQERDPAPAGTYDWPAEILEANYDMIRTAIAAKGIVVVEAGGNGGHDLDAYRNDSGKKIFDRSSADFRDSGAIIVGAASIATPPPYSRLSSSNHGNRIDCYAWGENIDTATAGVSGKSNTMYTTDFGGTSGASPIVAGVALILQGIRQAALNRGALGRRFKSRELRDILTTNGTLSKTPATDRIGVMPDLLAIITHNQSVLMPVPIPTPGPP